MKTPRLARVSLQGSVLSTAAAGEWLGAPDAVRRAKAPRGTGHPLDVRSLSSLGPLVAIAPRGRLRSSIRAASHSPAAAHRPSRAHSRKTAAGCTRPARLAGNQVDATATAARKAKIP